MISGTYYLEKEDLPFRGADLVLSASFDNLETEISPFRVQSLYQDEMNHVERVSISLH